MASESNTQPEISVVMPCYNGEKWLKESIESVLQQTFVNFELLIIDDGSADTSKEIIEEYKRRDLRIISVYKSHTGATDSQNVGIQTARGEWIARIDQDDVCEPKRLAKQLSFVKANPTIDLLGSGFIEIDKDGRFIKQHFYPQQHESLTANLSSLKKFFPHSSAFYRSKAARAAGGYNVRFTRADDWDLWLRLSEKGKIASLPEPLVKIRKHAEQMSLAEGNTRSFFDSIAASTCYFLRKAGHASPSMDPSDTNWFLFLNWVEIRINEIGGLDERKEWMEARAAYFTSSQKGKNKFHLFIRLIRTGYLLSMISNKFFGSSLPKKLASEWILANQKK